MAGCVLAVLLLLISLSPTLLGIRYVCAHSYGTDSQIEFFKMLDKKIEEVTDILWCDCCYCFFTR